MNLRPADPRRRRGTSLAVLAGLIAPAAVLAATPATADPGSVGSMSGAPASTSSTRAAAAALAAPAGDGADAAGFVFGGSGNCRPTLSVTTTSGQSSLVASDQGWYNSDGFHNPQNPNYIVGTAPGEGIFRNYFVFDTTALSGEVIEARLDVVQAGCSGGFGALSSYSLNDVTTPVSELVATADSAEEGQAIFRDLRVGELFGTTALTDVNQDVSVVFTAAGLASIAAADGPFAVGGAYYDKVRPIASTTLTVDPVQGEAGDDVTLTATVVGDEEGVDGDPTGTADFTESGTPVDGCTDVALVASESEADESTATCVVPAIGRGLYAYAATYSGDEVYDAGDAGELAYDTRATPEVTVGLTDGSEGVIRTEEVTLDAEVVGVAGETAPTGTVDFLDDGEPVEGCRDVPLGSIEGAATASCQAAFDTTGEHAVTVEYPGDETYEATEGGPLAVRVLSDAPTITAEVTSADEPSAAGWFQAPATVTFTCEGFQGVDECTEPVTVTRNGRTEVRGAATDAEGQQAFTTVVVKVDKKAPRIFLRGVRDGATYDQVRAVRCSAFDRHSRQAGRCTTETAVVKRFRDGRREIAYTATAADRADNVSVVSGSYFVR